MIIAFDGIGGAGKSTQIDLLKSHLDSSGMSCVVLKGGGTGGNTERLRKLKEKIDETDDPDLVLISETIKLQLLEIEKAINDGMAFILLDRTPVTYFASAYSKGKELRDIFNSEMLDNLSKFPSADITFLLKIKPSLAYKLLKGKISLSHSDSRATLDKDRKKMDFYLNYAKKNDWIVINVDSNGVVRNPELISATIWHHIETFTHR